MPSYCTADALEARHSAIVRSGTCDRSNVRQRRKMLVEAFVIALFEDRVVDHVRGQAPELLESVLTDETVKAMVRS